MGQGGCGFWRCHSRHSAAAVSLCRSSADCELPAGHGTFGSFCPAHARELADLRVQWFTADGGLLSKPRTGAAGPSLVDDARALTLEVLAAGTLKRTDAAEQLGWPPARVKRAFEIAVSRSWIARAAPNLRPGAVVPDGKIPKETRAAMLARFIHARGAMVPTAEAAKAIGLAPGGSFPRVVSHAKKMGLVTTANGPNGGIGPPPLL